MYGSVSSGRALADRAGRLLTLAEVDAAGQLADDQEVDAGQQLRPERRRRDEAGMDRHRPQVGEQLQLAPEREQALLRADGRGRVVPPRPADRAQQDRVALAGPGHVLRPDRHAVRVDRVAAGGDVRPGDVEAERLARDVEHAPRGARDLRSDAVTRDRRDPVLSSRGLFHDPWRDERDRDAVDLGAVELVDRHEVALERCLDDVRG